MRIYAKQVPPEYQESPLFWNDDINAEIYGNKQYKGITSALFDRLPGILDDLADYWETFTAGQPSYYTSWAEALEDIAPPQKREAYTREERKHTWPGLLARYCETYDDAGIYAEALELITGRAWDHCTLRGCCQGDWQYCIYPADDWDGASLERLEAEYFNTGTEWIIHDDENAPEGPEDINGFSVYCTGWNDDQIRQEIADAAGGSPETVTLYKFRDFRRVAEYEEA